jgi:hypothetical protein
MKAFWKSMTIWFNTVLGSMTAMIPLAMEQLPVLKEYLPVNWYMWALVLLTVGNVIIRARTHTAIGMRDA